MLGDSQARPFGTGDLPEDADALYAQGMTHYRRREWEEAKDYFARLRLVAPDRRGVDALLNEVDIFIQLQAMESTQLGMEGETLEPPDEQAPAPPVLEKPVAGRVKGRRVPWLAVIVVVAGSRSTADLGAAEPPWCATGPY